MTDAADPDLDAVEEISAPEPVLLRSDVAGVAGLTLNRSDQYNALSRELLGALQTELDRIKDDPATRVVVITGQGRAFCAGHDMKEIAHERERGKLTELFGQCSQVMLSLTRLPQPVIALVDGVAAAAGCQLVAACDLALATTNARFATSGVKYGLFCSTPMVALSRNLPRKPAMEMLLTGDFIEAEDALRLGLVNQVVSPDKLEEAFDAMLARLLSKPSDVLA
ncbi:MAG: enoyl-CoA hydratase-related protein, partial [Geminicoccaceae bacterium]